MNTTRECHPITRSITAALALPEVTAALATNTGAIVFDDSDNVFLVDPAPPTSPNPTPSIYYLAPLPSTPTPTQ